MLLIPSPILVHKKRTRDKSAWVPLPAEISHYRHQEERYITPHRSKRGKELTIAAGFRCRDGVLFCADSQLTIPQYLKFQQEKVICMASVRHSPCFAYCGNAYFSRDAIARAGTVIANSSDGMVTANVRKLATQICKEQAELAKLDQCVLQLLITFRRAAAAQLWLLWKTSLSPVITFQMIGAGMDMMTSAVQPFYSKEMTLREASYMAAYALYQTKEHVDSCGKHSLIYLAFDDGRRAVVCQEEIEELEASFAEFQKISAAALTARDEESLRGATVNLGGVLGNAFAQRKSRDLQFLK